ncbi:MAG: GGDEF domain-containing protein [Actinomycetota bacterium]|nr:GGDEF domain-containing protein [Actinomycetota bacterium]
MTPNKPTVSPDGRSLEIVSVSERMVYMQALRVTFACVVIAAAVFGNQIIGAALEDLSLATSGYLLFAAATEVLRRVEPRWGIKTVMLMLLVDGIYLQWVIYASGATQSPLRFLTFLHLIAVTLIASYRTGLKTALWHSLLFFAVFYAQRAELLPPAPTAAGAAPPSPWLVERLSVFNVLAFWLVALATAAFSRLNERELRKSQEDFERLAGMGTQLEHATQSEQVGRIVLESLKDAYGFKRGVVLAAPQGEPVLLTSIGIHEGPPLSEGRDAIIDKAWAVRETLLVKKLDPEENQRLTRLIPFARNLVIVPLFAESHPLGVMVLEQPGRIGRIERRVVGMVGQFGSHAALALRNAWLLEQVQKLAEIDALTNVANRRTFENTLAHELSRSTRHGDPLTLVMIDVDHFKKFNDSHGHRAGDAALRKVAEALAEESRDFDTVARYGGEEFAVILPACSSRESLIAAERLRRAVSEIDGLAAPVTASAGVATYPTHAADAETLIKTADEALYESKRSGRNRVTRSRRRAHKRRSPSTIAVEPT